MRIKLTKHQAEAIRLGITERHTLLRDLELRSALDRRFVNVLVLDNGGNPQDWSDYAFSEEGDERYLVMQPVPQASPLPEPKA